MKVERMKERTKISVAVITYNQESTIRQTLDSILMQKGNFDLELVIGEDSSTDNTYAICKEYAERYPDIVKLLPNTYNLGIMANYARVIEACTGEFIGDIAGDDFYCDDHALEKQMRYLQSHDNVGVMASNGYNYYVLRDEKVPGLNPVFEAEQEWVKSYYFSPEHMEGACLAPVGIMYRADLLKKYIDFKEILRRKLPVEDYPIQAILSQHTHFACLPDLLVTYRIYSSSATFLSFDSPRYLDYYRGLAETRRYLNELFPNDACVTEVMLQEQLFYKEFLLYLHQLNYKKAKMLIANHSSLIDNSPKMRQAKRFTRTWIHFFIVHIVKEYKYKQALKHNT